VTGAPPSGASHRPTLLARLVPHARGFTAFAIVGLTGVGVNLVVFSGLTRVLGTQTSEVLLASSLSFAVALLWNFFWNLRWTFAGLTHRSVVSHLFRYVLIQLSNLALNEAVLYFWVDRGGNPLLGQLGGILIGSVWGYWANRSWNFSEPVLAAGTAHVPPPTIADD
jgi:putative flippase GtrA